MHIMFADCDGDASSLLDFLEQINLICSASARHVSGCLVEQKQATALRQETVKRIGFGISRAAYRLSYISGLVPCAGFRDQNPQWPRH